MSHKEFVLVVGIQMWCNDGFALWLHLYLIVLHSLFLKPFLIFYYLCVCPCFCQAFVLLQLQGWKCMGDKSDLEISNKKLSMPCCLTHLCCVYIYWKCVLCCCMCTLFHQHHQEMDNLPHHCKWISLIWKPFLDTGTQSILGQLDVFLKNRYVVLTYFCEEWKCSFGIWRTPCCTSFLSWTQLLLAKQWEEIQDRQHWIEIWIDQYLHLSFLCHCTQIWNCCARWNESKYNFSEWILWDKVSCQKKQHRHILWWFSQNNKKYLMIKVPHISLATILECYSTTMQNNFPLCYP